MSDTQINGDTNWLLHTLRILAIHGVKFRHSLLHGLPFWDMSGST